MRETHPPRVGVPENPKIGFKKLFKDTFKIFLLLAGTKGPKFINLENWKIGGSCIARIIYITIMGKSGEVWILSEEVNPTGEIRLCYFVQTAHSGITDRSVVHILKPLNEGKCPLGETERTKKCVRNLWDTIPDIQAKKSGEFLSHDAEAVP